MPWTTKDVEQFKSGLTQAQKRQWVAVANTALREHQQQGGSYSESSAIRQANSVVNNSAIELKKVQINNQGYTIRLALHNGRKHLVVPVVMMVEGVHAGSAGALLHPANELGRWPLSWNGIPVTINHPQRDGMAVSVNDTPDTMERETIGRIFNSHMEGNKLKAEAWLDEELLAHNDSDALGHIRAQRPVEVSVGVFTDQEQVEGIYEGHAYQAIARNHRPDHLALLPQGWGACSWDDGCGIRNNEKGSGAELTGEPTLANKKITFEPANQINNKEGVNMANEKSDCSKEKVDQLIAHSGTNFTEDDRDWLIKQEEESINKMLPIETSKGGSGESKKADKPVATHQNNGAEKMDTQKAIETLKASFEKPEDFLSILPQEIQDQMKSGLALHQRHREGLVNFVLKNSGEIWTKEDLQEMQTNALEKVYKSVKKGEPKRQNDSEAAFMGMGSPSTNEGSGTELPKMLPFELNEDNNNNNKN